MSDRTPNDGKPYYCEACEAGFSEYLACELPICRLETDAAAKVRAASHGIAKETHEHEIRKAKAAYKQGIKALAVSEPKASQ